MATLILRKLYNSFVPVDQNAAELMEKMRPNAEFKAEITQPRNIGFHRKFFALLDVAFDAWDAPEIEHNGVKIAKNRDRFRKDIIIQCGFYNISVGIDGKAKIDAKSMSFSNMDEIEFNELYSSAIDVILGKVLTHYTSDDLEMVVQKVLGFC